MPLRTLLPAALLVSVCLAPACEQPAPALTPAGFDEVRAFADLRHLVEEIGDRRMGTPGAARARAYIREQLEPLGWVFEEDPFTAEPPEGARRKQTVAGINLIARRPGTEPGEIWLAGHYDTIDIPGFVGANDGGSSTALLIEAGRQLAGSGPREGFGVTLVWFDGEEPFTPVPWDDDTNSTFGSRHLAKRMKDEKKLDTIKALVLVDLVADRNLGVSIESRWFTPWVAAAVRRTETRLGFTGRDRVLVGSREVKDDHMHFHRLNVPCVDLIDFNYGPNNSWWHTREDTLDKCSAESLGKVGTLVLSALPEIERVARMPDSDR